jgi:hypothetical protein
MEVVAVLLFLGLVAAITVICEALAELRRLKKRR